MPGKHFSSLPPLCTGTLLAAAHALCSRSAPAEEALARAADALATLCKGSAPRIGPAAFLALLPGLAVWLGSAPEGGDDIQAHSLSEGALLSLIQRRNALCDAANSCNVDNHKAWAVKLPACSGLSIHAHPLQLNQVGAQACSLVCSPGWYRRQTHQCLQ